MRSFIRHPADIPIEVLLSNDLPYADRELKNVGLGGLCYQSNTRLSPNALVRLRIPADKPLFELQGRVTWCRQQDQHFEIGIQFLHEDEAFRARMVEQLCHIEHYRKQVFLNDGRVLSGQQAALEWIEKYAAAFP